MHTLYLNADPDTPQPEADPAELLEVEALVAEAHALEPIRTLEDLTNTGRFVVYPEGKRLGKDYKQEWPVIKAKYLPLLSVPMYANRA